MDADYSAWSREVEEEGSKNREMAALGSHFKEYFERDDEPGEGFKKQGSVCIVSEALSGCSCHAGGRAGAEAEDARGGDEAFEEYILEQCILSLASHCLYCD